MYTMLFFEEIIVSFTPTPFFEYVYLSHLRLFRAVHTPTEMTADALARSLFAKKTGIPQNVEKQTSYYSIFSRFGDFSDIIFIELFYFRMQFTF